MKTFPLTVQQALYIDSLARVRGFVSGRGAGKSTIACYDMIRRAKPGRHYLIAAPTYKMLEDSTYLSFCQVAKQIDCPFVLHKAEFRATLWNGANVLFRSADNPEKLRGPNLSGAILDEASIMSREAYEIVLACLRQGGEMGWLGLCFTPKGRLHFTYEIFHSGSPHTYLVQARTLDNPFLAQEFYETVKSQYSGLRARQELEGEFVDVSGAEWPAEYFAKLEYFDSWPSMDQFTVKTIALDPSKGKGQDKPRQLKPGQDASRHRDYSAFVLLARDKQGKLWIECDADNRRDITTIIRDGIDLFRRFPCDGFGIETNQFASMMLTEFERLSREDKIVMPLYSMVNTENKELRIRRITPYLAQGLFKFRANRGTYQLIEELRAWPESEHDDRADSLEMSIRLAVELWNGKQAQGATTLATRGR
jgi:predicted phage terminase large subunit-like protein